MYEPIHAQIARIRTEELIGGAQRRRAAREGVRGARKPTERAPRTSRLGRIAAGVLHPRPRLH